jgi:antitoxin YefM
MKTVEAKKAKISELLEESEKSHEPIQIIGKKNAAVLVSLDDWRAIEETLYLLSIPKMRESIVRGLKTPVEKCSSELDW